jgi:hypothetical protein
MTEDGAATVLVEATVAAKVTVAVEVTIEIEVPTGVGLLQPAKMATATAKSASL